MRARPGYICLTDLTSQPRRKYHEDPAVRRRGPRRGGGGGRGRHPGGGPRGGDERGGWSAEEVQTVRSAWQQVEDQDSHLQGLQVGLS